MTRKSPRPRSYNVQYGHYANFNGVKKEKDKFNWTLIISSLGLIATAFSLYFTSQSLKYTSQTLSNTEKWKRAEFIAAQYEKFSSDTSVVFVNQFLDYFSRFTTHKSHNALINKELVSIYLSPDSISEGRGFDGREKAEIRNYFDYYLDRLSLFNRYIHSGVIEPDGIKPYLSYQIELIAKPSNNASDAEFQAALWGYIDRYKFNDVKNLCLVFGYDISVKNDKVPR